MGRNYPTLNDFQCQAPGRRCLKIMTNVKNNKNNGLTNHAKQYNVIHIDIGEAGCNSLASALPLKPEYQHRITLRWPKDMK
jgi:hypothetical protein